MRARAAREGIRVFFGRAESGTDHADLAALSRDYASADRDARGCGNRIQAENPRDSGEVEKQDHGVGSAESIRG